jgi:hypothetical protein
MLDENKFTRRNPKKMLCRHWLLVLAWFVVGLCLLLAASPLSFQNSNDEGQNRSEANTACLSVTPKSLRVGVNSRPIEQIRVGDRVLARNPELLDRERPLIDEVDPPMWRKLTLKMPKQNGEALNVTLLRPNTWLEDRGVREGAEIILDIPEVGAIGPAVVESVEACPDLSEGRGAVVTGTFVHQSERILALTLSCDSQPIGATSNHPFWSEDRQAFVLAEELEIGERLRCENGTDDVRVAAIVFQGRREPVFNLEVWGEHVYFVGQSGVLVHNNYFDTVTSRIKESEKLVKHAQESGQRVQKSLDSLQVQLRKGNLDPGIGTKRVFGDVFEARSRDGARLYFRTYEQTITKIENGVNKQVKNKVLEIVGKSDKHNQPQVISELQKLYGG